MNNQEWSNGSKVQSSRADHIYNPTAILGFNPPPVL